MRATTWFFIGEAEGEVSTSARLSVGAIWDTHNQGEGLMIGGRCVKRKRDGWGGASALAWGISE